MREMIGVECDQEEPIVLVATAPRDRPTDVIRGRDGRRVPFIDVSRLRGTELFEAACELLVDAAEAAGSPSADRPEEGVPRQVGLDLPAGIVDSTFALHSVAGSPWREVADRVDATGDQRAALVQGLRILMVASCVSEAIRRTADPSHHSAAESLGVYIAFDALWQAIAPAWSMYLARAAILYGDRPDERRTRRNSADRCAASAGCGDDGRGLLPARVPVRTRRPRRLGGVRPLLP